MTELTTPVDADSVRPEARLGYLPGLDGLRAVSVVAVLAFHFRPDRSLLPGGFLGVEVFFVISGYLITSLLLVERRAAGNVSLRRFWLRRIRRLWPALLAMMIAVGAIVAIGYHDDLARLKGDLLFGFYGENWWQIFHGVSYFHATGRQPFVHLWSLAVEEQFYLLWPMLFALGMWFFGRRRFRFAVAGLAGASWLASVLLLATHTVSTNALYLATPTRAYGLLIGALTAFFWTPRQLRGQLGRNAPRVMNSAAAVSMLLLAALFLTVHQDSHTLYYFGFLLTDALTVVLIATVVHPAASVNRWLGMTPLRAIGQRSYGIYLWGIAIFEFTRPAGAGPPDIHDLHSQLTALLVRAVLVVAVAECSYRYLELPIRRGALGRAWNELHVADDERHAHLLRRWQGAGVAIALVVAMLGVLAGTASESKAAKQLTDYKDSVGGGDCVLHGCAIPTAPTTATVSTRPSTHPTGTPTTAGIASSGWKVTAVGDSVMLGASTALQTTLSGPAGGPVLVNAAVGRQANVCIDVLQYFADQHMLGPTVIVHCGDNGTLGNNFVGRVIQIAGPKRKVVFLTVKVPRGWEESNNAQILDGVKGYKNARVVDWHWWAIRLNPQNAFFYDDQYHLRPAGRTYYANKVRDTLRHWGWL